MEDFINIENVSFSYSADDENIAAPEYVLKDISMKIKKGEFVALLGHNGCGKSTLARLLNAMSLPNKGKIYINGVDTSQTSSVFDIRKTVGLVLQNPDNQLVASIVEEDVAFGPENLGIEPSEIRKRVDDALKAVDMYDYRAHAPFKLSGGQKQRVAIAGIIAMQPQCLVLDEPTAMLDPKGRDEVMSTVKKLNRENGITIVLITHYMDEAVQADRVIVMDDGKVLISGRPREVFSQVELLKRHRLDVPQATELMYRLKGRGFSCDEMPLNSDECIRQLEKMLKRNN